MKELEAEIAKLIAHRDRQFAIRDQAVRLGNALDQAIATILASLNQAQATTNSSVSSNPFKIGNVTWYVYEVLADHAEPIGVKQLIAEVAQKGGKYTDSGISSAVYLHADIFARPSEGMFQLVHE